MKRTLLPIRVTVMRVKLHVILTKVNVKHCGIGSLHNNVLMFLNGFVEIEHRVSHHRPNNTDILLQYIPASQPGREKRKERERGEREGESEATTVKKSLVDRQTLHLASSSSTSSTRSGNLTEHIS